MTSRPPAPPPRARPDARGTPPRDASAAARGGFFLLALLLHALGGLKWAQLGRGELALPAPTVPTPTLSAAGRAAALDASRRALAVARRPPPAAPAPKPPAPTKPPERRSGQVVSLPPDPSGRRPKNTARLAEHDAYAEKESVSRNPAAGARDVMHERTAVRRGTARPDAPPEGRLEDGPAAPRPEAPPEAKPQGRSRVVELPEQRARDRLVLRPGAGVQALQNHDAAPAIRGNAERLRVDVGSPGDERAPAGGPRRTLTMAQLIPDVGVLARVAGAPAPDHVPDVARGEGTFLNAHGYRYASFFNRLHAQVAAVWHPQDEVRRRDPTGNIYGAVDRTTLVFVSLNDRGGLEEVVVQESSGVAFLDQIAVDAFRRAAPFLHPPRGLPNEDGRVNFSFGFHLSTQAPSAFGAGF